MDRFYVMVVLIVLAVIMPASAAFYVVNTSIHQGATVFIGEQGLNLTPAVNAYAFDQPTSIGWWDSVANVGTTAPTAIVPLTGINNFLVSYAAFGSYYGNWYAINGTTGAANTSLGACINVKDPQISVDVWDWSQGTQGGISVSGKSVIQGDNLTFKISTNMDTALNQGQLRQIVAGQVAEGTVDIKVKTEQGNTFTQLLNVSNQPNALTNQFVNTPTWYWGTTGAVFADKNWSTSAQDATGQVAYPAGTYIITVQSMLNGMYDNYQLGGAAYTGKTISEAKTVTLVSNTVKINGTIYYAGTQNATIYVRLFNQTPGPGVPPMKTKTMTYFGTPINYGFSTFNGTFWVMAFMDLNGNQTPDANEPRGFAINKSFMQGPDPIIVTGNMTGLDITLYEPQTPNAHLQIGNIVGVASWEDSLTHGIQPVTIDRGLNIGNDNPKSLVLDNVIITIDGSHITNAGPMDMTTWNSTHIRWDYTSPVTLPPFNEMDAGYWHTDLTDTVDIPYSINRWVNQSTFTSPGYQLFTYNATFENTTCDWIFGRISAGYGLDNATLLIDSFTTDASIQNLRLINDRDIGFNLNMSTILTHRSYNFSIVVFVDPTNAQGHPVEYKPWCQMMEGFNTGFRSGVLNSSTASMPADMLPLAVTNLTISNDIPLNWNYRTNNAKSMILDTIWRYPSGGPNKINGTIYYSGTQNATIYVALFDQTPGPDVSPIKTKTMTYFGSPISYGFSTFNGTFWVASFVDLNGNQIPDLNEPLAYAINKSFMQGPDPIHVTGTMIGLDITLYEPPRAELMLTKDFEIITKNNTIMSGTQDSRLRYQMSLTPTRSSLVLGNLSFTLAAQNLSGVDYEPFAVWNTSTAVWTFPPEYTVGANNGQGVTAFTSTHKTMPLNMSLNRWANQTRFSENGTQLLTANITFTSTDFLGVSCIVDIPYTTLVHAKFIPGSVTTDAPMEWVEIYDQWILFGFNRTEIRTGVPYTVSVVTQVEPNGTPVEFMPRISATQTFSYNSTPGSLSPVGMMPAGLLPQSVSSASAAINISTFWNFYAERDNVVATLDRIVQPVSLGPVAHFTANVTAGTAPLTVQFTDTSTGSPTGWNWSFGDGNFSTLQHPVYTYTSAGDYSVSLNATNTVGSNTTTRINYILVGPSGGGGGGGSGGGTQLILPNASLYQNTPTQLPIRFSNITGGTGLSFNLTYDPSVIRINDIKLNSSYASGSNLVVNLTAGFIRVSLTRTEGITIGSPTTVLFLNTTGTGAVGSRTLLTASDAVWSTSGFEIQQFDAVNGTVLVYRVRGDFNGNGYVDIGDVSRVAYMVVGLTLVDPAADFNNNGVVDIGDASKIAYYFVGKIAAL